MKYNKSIITLMLTACTSFMGACSDSYMEDLNTDPSKADVIDPNAQLTTAQLQTYGRLDLVEIYRSYLSAFNQQFMGCWNTTNYGGRHTINNDVMGYWWTLGYTGQIANLVDAEYRTKDDPAKTNINAVLNIYKVYIMSVITDLYGDVPYSEAGKGYLESIFNPKYDEQKDIYYDFFTVLSKAAEQLDPSKDAITGDVIYDGDVTKWKKFANSLRLRFAMRISNVDPQKAQAEFENALNADGGIFTSADDDAMINYMEVSYSFGSESYSDYRGNAFAKLLYGNDPANNPTYLCSTFFNQMYETNDPRTFRIARCYYDGLMSTTSPDNRIDLTDEMLEKGIAFQPCVPGGYSWEPWPTGYDSDILKAMAENNPDIIYSVTREVEPKLATTFLMSDNPGVVMTYSEVMFLLAEAKLKGWNVGSSSVEDYYKTGVREAMAFLSAHYDCEEITDAEFDAYYANNPIGYTDAQKLKSINTQAWLLHFLNPAECWANIRRSGYPELKSPAEYGFGQYLTDGQEIPVRLCYPILESSYNKANYDEAVQRMGGEDSWYNRVWWDSAN